MIKLKRSYFAVPAFLLLVKVALAGGALWLFSGKSSPEPLQLSGNVEIRQVNLAFKVSGRISGLLVDEGERVAAEQPLGSLDRVYFDENLAQVIAQRDQMAAYVAKLEAGNREEDIAQAEAAVAEREATFANAQSSFGRAEHLLKAGTGTRKTFDDAYALQTEARARLSLARNALRLMRAGSREEDIKQARAQLAEREAAVQVARRQLADTEVRAPNDGIVLSRVRERGAIVNAGETVFVLSLTNPVWIRSYVSEQDLGRIHPGMEVELRTDTAQNAPVKGRIGFISPTAEFTPKTVETRELRTALVYRLRIVVDQPAEFLRQGMPVTVTASPEDRPS